MNWYGRWLGMAAGLLTAAAVQANVKMPEIFGDGMVLQRDMKVPVWGWAAPGENVTVKIAGQTQKTVTGGDGRWQVELAPLQAGGPLTMEIDGNNQVRISDVLVGEVWLCSGQSNMEFMTINVDHGREEVAGANYPQLRLFLVKRAWNPQPQEHLSAKWAACTPSSVTHFPAVGYFFGRELQRKLKVPVGLLGASWGGTRIEPWTPPVGFKAVPELRHITREVELQDPASAMHKEAMRNVLDQQQQWIRLAQQCLDGSTVAPLPPIYPRELQPFNSNQNPTVLYNAMIYPMVPYALRGVIWYQGEANLNDGKIYGQKMRALVKGWQQVFHNPGLAFYFVQLAPYNYGEWANYMLPLMWETQAEFAASMPNVGMAVINDIGNLKNIHPTNKQDVGHRLALLALAGAYDRRDVVCDSPAFKSMRVAGNQLIVDFTHAKELKTRDGKAPSEFEIAGMNGIYFPAEVKLSGTSAMLSSPKVDHPLAMRFAWHMLAVPNLVNEAGLPAGAFRAGEIPERGLLDSIVPEARNFKLVYSLDPTNPVMANSNRSMVYRTDRAKEIVGKIKRVGYFMGLLDGDRRNYYVWVTMSPFTDEVAKLGVPTKNSGARFQMKVKNLTVKSNVAGVVNGDFPEGNIEFWDCNYGEPNAAKIPGAADNQFDFGDQMAPASSPGYGSMQIHNFLKKQTVLAFNHWSVGRRADVGIGNNPKDKPDWTFSSSAQQYAGGQLLVLVELE